MTSRKDKKGISLKCKNKKCGNQWMYKGKLKKDDFVTCGKCRFRYKKGSMVSNALTKKSVVLSSDASPKKIRNYLKEHKKKNNKRS